MSDPASRLAPVIVPDASVLVKLFRQESGTEDAVSLLKRHGAGEVRLVLAALCVQETLNVARRELDVPGAREVWRALRAIEAPIVEFDDTVAEAAFSACERYGCTFYDAVAPAVADLIGATLWSGDARAHGRVSGVVLL